ncbi:MAG: hypothetical protein KDA77_10175 [Planctomycetaceae bacterium]|nr:hypothetical protein [Planctomycetaceae bacterium]
MITKKIAIAVVSLSSVLLLQTMHAAEPVLIAHRGMLRHAPENTLPAFRVCLDLRIGFELDIRTTKDGELVIIHDDSVQRTTDGPKRSIRELNWSEVKQLDAGRWFDPLFAGTRVPTLEQTLQLIKERKQGDTIIALNIKQLNPAGEKKLVQLLEKYNLFEDSFAFDQSVEMSKRLKQLNPRIRIGQNVNRQSIDARLKENQLDVFLLTFVPQKREVDRLKQQGKQVLFNFGGSGEARRNPAVWNQVRAAGIEGMLTDYPLECRQVWRDVDQGDKN